MFKFVLFPIFSSTQFLVYQNPPVVRDIETSFFHSRRNCLPFIIRYIAQKYILTLYNNQIQLDI